MVRPMSSKEQEKYSIQKESNKNDCPVIARRVGLLCFICLFFLFSRNSGSNGVSRFKSTMVKFINDENEFANDNEEDHEEIGHEEDHEEMGHEEDHEEMGQDAAGLLSSVPVVDKATQVYHGNNGRGVYTGWTVDERCLRDKKQIIAYGVGCGTDISYDESLFKSFNAKVFLFDPTPKSIKYVEERLTHYDVGDLTLTKEGLAAKKEIIYFTKPKNKNFVSLRKGVHSKNPDRIVTLPVNTLDNWMEANGHEYLDVLKIDIEGAEFEVLEDMIAKQYFPMTQLLVEFHNRWEDGGENSDRRGKIMKGLRENGFRIFKDKHRHEEISFIKKADLPYCITGKHRRNPYTNNQTP